MSPGPTRETLAGRVYNDLRNLARSQGRDPAEFFELYALEGFLARLAASRYAQDLVLKGGVLLAAFEVRRPTRDVDLAASGFPNDVEEVERRLRQILAVDVEDGLEFNVRAIRSEVIRDEADYTGVRVHLAARLATAEIAFHVDVNFGDPIWPAPQETTVPRLLGGEVRLLGYPVHMVLAEKIVTAVDRGSANTRWRDFVDIASISQTQAVTEHDLTTALRTVAEHRHVELRPLFDTLADMATNAQARWAAWRRKQRLTSTTPEAFQDLLDQVIAFADPVLDGSANGYAWQPLSRAWTS